MKRIPIWLVFLAGFCLSASPVLAQNQELMEAQVVDILAQTSQDNQVSQSLSVLVKTGRFADQKVVVDTGFYDPLTARQYEIGDRIILALTADIEGNNVFYVADYIRRPTLLILSIIFVVLVLLVGGKKGFFSLLGLALSFLAVMLVILPLISQGKNPVMVSILASLLLVPLLFYTSHGFNRKTTIAAISTVLALVVTGILAKIFLVRGNISGLSSEEMSFLSLSHKTINPQGLVLAGIIIGTLGVLDDVTVSQSAIVESLKRVNPKIKAGDLFKESLSVGRDHIASMVNTLVLVYAGSALPLLLLFIDSAQKMSIVINYEIIAEELIRTLVGSIGLVLAVPVTTLLAVLFVEEKKL